MQTSRSNLLMDGVGSLEFVGGSQFGRDQVLELPQGETLASFSQDVEGDSLRMTLSRHDCRYAETSRSGGWESRKRGVKE